MMTSGPELSQRDMASAAAAALLAATVSVAGPLEASAVGPVSMELQGITYSPVECPANLKEGRIGGSLTSGTRKDVFQQCINVKATTTNPSKKKIKDAGVFGFVSDEAAGASVIANNPDFRSDAGQFAQVDWIEPGEDVPIDFVFVGTFSKRDNSKDGELPELTFKGIKAISYPGGARFVELSPCELDSLAPECEDVSDEDRAALKTKSMAGLKSMQE